MYLLQTEMSQLINVFAMVNFMCHLGLATMPPKYLVKHYSGNFHKAILDDINI